MCGVIGFWGQPGQTEDLRHKITPMSGELRHRGPDDCGYWLDLEAGIAIGHQRLSIVDTSPEGHQPMLSETGRYVISYNGEVYNFRKLREELEELGHIFNGHSDTVVVLAAVEQWGLRDAVKRFNGMFAFSVWDRQERALHLVRDRVGIKPMYYGWAGNDFLFGSELKAFVKYQKFQGNISREALALYLRYGYVPAPLSIYEKTYKLTPGVILTMRGLSVSPEIEAYWNPLEIAEHGVASPFQGSDLEAADQIENLLQDSVRLQKVADVPLGAFLSGGIDSSTVVALMQQGSSFPVKTFSIGFHEKTFNEANHAKQVASYLGTDHTELYMTYQDCIDIVPKLPDLYDEPFADSSQIPTFLVSKLARKQVTVCLSGDGGDELFGGYNWYLQAKAKWRTFNDMPGPMRSVLNRPWASSSVHKAVSILNRTAPRLPWVLRRVPLAKRAKRFVNTAATRSRESMYQDMVSHWRGDIPIVEGGVAEPITIMTNPEAWGSLRDFTDWMMYIDLVTYLPDDILTKVDRASMAVSLECRVPILDHRVLESSWHLPQSMKFRHGQTKWILRQVLYKYVPRSLIERPKMGFSVPLGDWLRGPLREWAEVLLDETRLHQQGYLNPKPIRQLWKRHLSEQNDYGSLLWDVLMFQAWKEKVGS